MSEGGVTDRKSEIILNVTPLPPHLLHRETEAAVTFKVKSDYIMNIRRGQILLSCAYCRVSYKRDILAHCLKF